MRSSKQIMLIAIVAVALTGLFSAEAAAAPPNDNFANAQVISGFSGSLTPNNIGATKQAGEPVHAWNIGGHSVWFKYVAVGNGVLTIYTGGFDTLLAVYSGSTLSNLKQVAANDNIQTAGLQSPGSRVFLGTQTGMTYYIAVDGRTDANGFLNEGNFDLEFQVTNAPANDNLGQGWADANLSTTDNFKYVTGTNVGAGKEANEPNHAGNPGGKSIWFHYQLGINSHQGVNFTAEGRSVADPGLTIPTLIAIYRGETMATLTPVTSAVATAGQPARLVFDALPNTSYYIAVDSYDAGAGAVTANFLVGYGTTKSRKIPDFDRDGIADISVYRPSNGYWYTLESSTGAFRAFQWGANGDKPLFNHFDGDEKPDYTVYRPDTQVWHGYRSFDNSYLPFSWGLDTDVPLTFNHFAAGTMRTYAATFRPTNGVWYIRSSPATTAFQWGQSGDIPMTFDLEGDGTDEVAVFRPANGTWYIANPFTGAVVRIQQFGLNGDKPVPADYDGDGKVDLAVFRPSNGTWYIFYSTEGLIGSIGFGLGTDVPQPGDYEGNGYASVAVFRPSNGTWYIRRYNSVRAVQFGANGDIPMSAPVP